MSDFKLLPKKPTDAMVSAIDAFFEKWQGITGGTDTKRKAACWDALMVYDLMYEAAEFVHTELAQCERAWREERQKYRVIKALLLEARDFLNAQAYTEEEMEDFCGRLDDYFGIPRDTKEST